MRQDPDYDFEHFEMRATDSESGSEYETNNPESSIDSSIASDSEFDDGDSQGFRRLGADGENQQNMYLMEKSKKRLVIKDGKIMPGASKGQRKVGGGEEEVIRWGFGGLTLVFRAREEC